ncbi:hypothetical protein PVK06_023207 [Gossypium arboreum]|uniref:Uncharacterized protein n=1 Tax=Gossypium arboreum TaxID=29729 RepID=A0ABR0PAL9_GOSAR|nr:hypothetical protein PVK06_023207 [Gossypium arboreum]
MFRLLLFYLRFLGGVCRSSFLVSRFSKRVLVSRWGEHNDKSMASDKKGSDIKSEGEKVLVLVFSHYGYGKGINLERNLISAPRVGGNSSKGQDQSEMNYDSKEGVLVGGDGKKRPKREGETFTTREELEILVVRNMIVLERNLLLSTAVKRQADRL